MKKIIFSALLLFPISVFAQKVNKKTGAIMYQGEEIGKVEKSGGLAKSFTLYDASGEEIASFEPKPNNPQEEYFEIFFAQTDNKGTCPGNVGFANKIAKAFVRSKIMKDGQYQANKEARFMSILTGKYYGGNVVSSPMGTEKIGSTNRAETNLLERDRNAVIQVFGNVVKQDFKKIASVKKSQKAANGTILIRIKFFNHSGVQIAEATSEGVMNTEYKVVTFKDNETQYVTAESSLFIVRDIVAALVEDYYL